MWKEMSIQKSKAAKKKRRPQWRRMPEGGLPSLRVAYRRICVILLSKEWSFHFLCRCTVLLRSLDKHFSVKPLKQILLEKSAYRYGVQRRLDQPFIMQSDLIGRWGIFWQVFRLLFRKIALLSSNISSGIYVDDKYTNSIQTKVQPKHRVFPSTIHSYAFSHQTPSKPKGIQVGNRCIEGKWIGWIPQMQVSQIFLNKNRWGWFVHLGSSFYHPIIPSGHWRMCEQQNRPNEITLIPGSWNFGG